MKEVYFVVRETRDRNPELKGCRSLFWEVSHAAPTTRHSTPMLALLCRTIEHGLMSIVVLLASRCVQCGMIELILEGMCVRED